MVLPALKKRPPTTQNDAAVLSRNGGVFLPGVVRAMGHIEVAPASDAEFMLYLCVPKQVLAVRSM